MKKKATLIFLIAAAALLAPFGARAEDWPQFLNDQRHSGRSANPVLTPLTPKWSYDTGSVVTMSPVKAGDKVFLGTRNGMVVALNAYTGTLEWQYDAGDSIGGAPAVADGRIYFNTVGGQLYCLNAADGALVWRYTTSGLDLGTPTVAGGVVYVGTGYPNQNLLALDAATGAWKWQFYVGQPILNAPAYGDGVVWIGAGSGIFYGLDAQTGSKVAQFQTGGISYFTSPSILDGVVFLTGGEYDRKIYALSVQTGAEIWESEPVTDNLIVKASSISSSDGKVFISIGYPNQKIVALDASNGGTLWTYDSGDASVWNFMSTPIVSGDVVYVGAAAGNLIALNKNTGALLAQMSVGGAVVASPAIADGIVYVATVNGLVKAYLGTDATPPTAAITSPAAGELIGGTVAIAGTASDTNLERYTVEYGEGDAPSSWNTVAVVAGGVNVTGGTLAEWNVTGLQTATYTIRLTAVDTAGHSSQAAVAVLVDPDPPSFAGLGAVARGASDTDITLSWDAASDANEPVTYYIFKSETASGQAFDSAPFATTSATTFDTTVSYGESEYFVVRAADRLGNIDSNTVEKAYVTSDATSPAFAGLTSIARGGSDTEAVLSWDAATDSSGGQITYNIYKATAAGAEDFGAAPFATTSATSLNVNVPYGGHDYFVARAEDAAGNEDSNTVEKDFLTVDTVAPTFAGLESVTRGGSDTSVALVWQAASDASGGPITYKIYKTATPGVYDFAGAPAAATTSVGVELPVAYGENSYFVVRAADAAGNTETNTVEKVYLPDDTTPPSFGGLKTVARGGSDTEVVLSWDAATDASGSVRYAVYKATAAGTEDFNTPLLTTAETSVSATVAYGARAYFVVRAADAAGNGETNTIEKDFMPADTVAPEFDGVVSVARGGSDTTAVLSWNAATDAAGPVSYTVYKAATSGAEDFDAPLLTTTQLTAETAVAYGEHAYFVVRAVDAAGNEETNTIEKDYQPADTTPPVFTGLGSVVQGSSDDEVVLSWGAATDVSGAVTYNVYSSVRAGAYLFDVPLISATTSTSMSMIVPADRATYFVVRAVDAAGNEDSNLIEKAYIPSDTTAPTFAGLASVARGAADTTAVLTWEAAEDAVGPVSYAVYKAAAAGAEDFNAPLLTTAELTAETTVAYGETAYFVVRAVDAAGNQETNTVEVEYTPADTTPPTFGGLRSVARGGSDTSAILSWSAATDASGAVAYKIYKTTAQGTYDFASPLATATVTTAEVAVSYGASSYFVVRAVDASGNEDSNLIERAYTPADTTPPVFAGLVSVSRGSADTRAALSWAAATDAGGAVSYKIYRAASAGAENFAAPAAIVTANAAEMDVAYGESAYFVVRAVDAAGNEETNTVEKAYSAADYTAPVFAGLASAEDVGTGGAVTLSWDAATDNMGGDVTYKIYMAATSGGYDFGAPTATADGSPYTLTGLTNGTAYYFVVRATDAAGNEDTNAVEKSATPTDSRAAVTISEPPAGTLTNRPYITVRGTTAAGYGVTVSGVAVQTDTAGGFSATAALNAGSNTIAVVSTDPVTGAQSSASVAVTYQASLAGFTAAMVSQPEAEQTVSAPVALTVKLAAAAGTPVFNASATFRIDSQPSGAAGAAFSAAATATGYDGTAATTFTLGDKTGSYTVICEVKDNAGADVAGSPITLTFNASPDSQHLYVPGSADLTETPGGEADKDSKGRFTKLLVDGQGRTLISYTDPVLGGLKADGKTKAEFKIVVYDIHGNIVPGITVKLTRTFAATAGRSAGRSAAQTAASSQEETTDENGAAVFEDSTIDPGDYDYQAEVGGADYGPAFRVAYAASAIGLGDVHIYPNPWRPGNQLCFAGDISASITFTIKIYDIRGSRVRDIAGAANPLILTPDGRQQAIWCGDGVNNGGRPLASGVYLYYFEAWDAATGEEASTKGKFSVVR